MALASALVALTIIAALGAGTLTAAVVVNRSARDATAVLRASLAAEGAVALARHPWDVRRNQLAVGASDTIGLPRVGDAAVTARVVRLDATRLLVEATAHARASAPGAGRRAERTTTAVIRLVPAAPIPRGAVTAGSAIALANGATVDGADHVPDGWTGCAAPSAPMPAAAVDADVATYDTFGAERYGAVAARGAVQIDSPVATLAPIAPTDAAAFPIAHARGAVTLRGPTRGQGMLLVDGDLTIDGLVTFAGIMVVRGALHAGGGTLQLDGALFVQATVAGGALGAGSRVRWSSCAYARARDGAARVTLAGRRSLAFVTR